MGERAHVEIDAYAMQSSLVLVVTPALPDVHVVEPPRLYPRSKKLTEPTDKRIWDKPRKAVGHRTVGSWLHLNVLCLRDDVLRFL